MPQPLTVMTWNIKSLAGSWGGHADDAATRAIAAEINRVDPDVVLLQEVDNGTRRSGGIDQTALLAQLTHATGHAFAPAMSRNGGSYGVALLTRHHAHLAHDAAGNDRVMRIALPHSWHPWEEPRVALAAQVETDAGAHLAVITTHLSLGDPARDAQLHALPGIIDAARRQAGDGAAAIFTGDLNAAPGVVRPVLTGSPIPLTDALLAAGLRDGTPERQTFPSLHRSLDHVYVDGPATVTGARVEHPGPLPIVPGPTPSPPARGMHIVDGVPREHPSDHLPVVVTVTL